MKKAIVIGASTGIGKGLAGLLVENGYKVGITGRRTELLCEIKKQKPDSFLTKTFDATNTNISVKKLDELITELGGLDLLILSSGTGELNESLVFNIERKVIDLNVTGFTNIVDWAFYYFEKQNYGHLAALTSAAGIRGSRQAPSYNASKSYQINYLEGLRQKSTKSKKPIFVTDIRPGLVDTNMAKGEGLFWVMPVEKVVRQIFKAIKKRRKVVYVTKRWGFVGRLLKILPRFIYDRM
jgi:short-subunit dehydrogenase